MVSFSPFPRARPRGKCCGGTEKKQVVYVSPSVLPLGLGPPRAQEGTWVQTIVLRRRRMYEYEYSRMQLNTVGARLSRAAPGRSGSFLR